MIRPVSVPSACLAFLISGAAGCSSSREEAVSEEDIAPAVQESAPDSIAGLEGTSWRLVKFEGGDGTVLTPDDPSKYTLAFEPEGRLTARIDCNRGMGTWQSSGPSHLEFGPLALTRAMCPPASLHDHMVKQLPYVRSYIMEDGHLHLSLMADGGIYEFEPAGTEGR
jgi:para-nitrobenzyl esterase